MRKEVPKLTNHITNEDFLRLITDSFQSVVFGTVDQDGNPLTNVADIELYDNGQLILPPLSKSHFTND